MEKQGRLKVVIIDDDESAVELLEYNFAKNGLDTICFSDSTTAMSFLKNHKVDVIVTDWMMPHKSGVELIESLATSVNKESKKIMVSCISDQKSIDKALASGLDGYVTKPIKVKDFVAQVKAVFAEFS